MHAQRLWHIAAALAGLLWWLTGCEQQPPADLRGGSSLLLSDWQYTVTSAQIDTPAQLIAKAQPWLPYDPGHEPWDLAPRGANLWLRTALPNGPWREPSIYLYKVRGKFAAFLDDDRAGFYAFGHQVAGEPDYLGEPDHLMPLPADFHDRSLYLRLDSPIGQTGIAGHLAIGNKLDHLGWLVRHDVPLAIISMIPLFIGLILLGSALSSRIDRTPMSLGLFCLGFAVYSLGRTKIIYLFLPYPLAWDYFQYGLVYLIPGLFVDFAGRVLGGYRQPWLDRGKWFFALLSGAAVTLSLTGIATLPETLAVFHVAVILALAALLDEVGRKLVKKDPYAWIMAGGVALVCVGAVNDILVERRLLPWSTPILNFVMLVFIAALSLVAMRRLKREANERLIMQKELETAGILQTTFLPQRALTDREFALSAFNRSAAQVGGDWYAYRLFSSRWLHLHIADVTGHGTRAAMAAAFAKGALDLYYQECLEQAIDNPPLDRLHRVLNSTLFDVGRQEATMTMVSLAIDLTSGDCIVVSSGHPAPLLYTKTGRRQRKMQGPSQCLLGLEPQLVLQPPLRTRLSGDELIILHSDGVGELFSAPVAQAPARSALSFLNQHAGESPSYICDSVALYTSLCDRDKPIADDVTLLALKLNLAAA